MSKIIVVLVEVLIFTSVIGTIANSVFNAPENLTGAALVLYGLVTLIIVIGFVLGLMKTMGVKTGR